jgi:hypothetical protein
MTEVPMFRKSNKFPSKKTHWDRFGDLYKIGIPVGATLVVAFANYFFTESARTALSAEAQEHTRRINDLRIDLEEKNSHQKEVNDARMYSLNAKQVLADEVKLTSELVKALDELNPNASMSCNAQTLTPLHIRLICTVTNKGIRAIQVRRIGYDLIDNDNRKKVAKSLERIDSDEEFTVTPKSEGNWSADIFLKPESSVIQRKTHEITFSVQASPYLVKMYKQLTKNYFTDAEIGKISKRNIIFRLNMCRSEIQC